MTVNILGTNDAAVIRGTRGSEGRGVAEARPDTKTATGTLTDTDVDNAANTFQAVSSPTASDNNYGTYSGRRTGHWSYTLDGADAPGRGTQ